MILEIDIIELEHKKELRKLEQEKNEIIQELTDKLRSLGISEEEIERLSRKKREAEN